MNHVRLLTSALGAFAAYMAVGGVFFAIPALRAEFLKHSGVYRGEDGTKAAMTVGMLGIIISILALAVLFAMIFPGGSGVVSGIGFGALIGVYATGSFVMHNYSLLRISGRLSVIQGVVHFAEWLAVGAVIALIYRGPV